MKRHISKRLLSVVLSVVLVLGTMPFVSATTAYAAATDSEITALKAQITAYTQKMNGSVYTNMKGAYNAYINAYKLYDAAYYGNNSSTVTSTAVVNATNTLASYVSDSTSANYMTLWSPVTVTSPTISYGNTVPTYDEQTRVGYSRNIIYCSTPSTAGGYEKEGFMYKFTLPQNAVFLYDGGELRMPMMLAAHNNGGWMGNTRYPLGFLINQNIDKSDADNNYFHLAQVWQGHHEITKSGGPSAASDWDWEKAWSRESEDSIPGYDNASFGSITADNRGQKQDSNNGNKWWEFANYMRYVGSGQSWNKCLQDVKFSFTGVSMRDTTIWTTSDNDYHYYFEGSNGSNANYHARYYIIDYSGVASSLGTAAANFLNFNYKAAQYNQDGSIRRPESVDHYYLGHELDNLLTYIENLQFDPTTGFTSSNYATKAASNAETIYNNLSSLNAITEISDNTVGYQTLREKMYMTDSNDTSKANARVTFNNGNSNPQVWTAATWTPFSTAYTTAKDIFDGALSAGYSDATAATAASQATTVQTTYYALRALADFSPIDNAITAVQNKAQAHKDADNNTTDYRYKKSVIDALVAELADTTKYPYLHKDAAQRITYDLDSNAAIAAEAATIAALADTMLDLNGQIDVSVLKSAVAEARDKVTSVDPDAYQGIEEAQAALDAYDDGAFITTVSVPGTCTVAAVAPEVSVYEDQATLDTEIAPLVELQPRQYNVYLNYDNAGNKQLYGTYSYGDVVNINSPSPTGDAVDWEYSYVSRTSGENVSSSIVPNETSFSFVVKGETTIVTKAKSKYDTIAITYISSLGKVYAVEYVPVNAVVNPADEGRPNYIGYTFKNYSLDTFTATENTTVVARYEPTSTETYTINFVNFNGEGTFGNPSNSKAALIPYNTRMEFSSDDFASSMDGDIYSEDYGEEVWSTFLAYKQGGSYSKNDDYTPIKEGEYTPIPATISIDGEDDYAWGDDLYAISMVPEENYNRWRSVASTRTGRRYAVTVEDGMKVYDTTKAPNTEKLLAVGSSLNHVWYAQQNCYLVFYTQEQFEDAVQADIFENIDPDADLDTIVAAYGYDKTTYVYDEYNTEKNYIKFRGSNVVLPDNANLVETGMLFKYKKNATAQDRENIANANLTLQTVGENGIQRVKMQESNITRLQYNTGHQFATNILIKGSSYPQGSTFDVKYRVYVNYTINGDYDSSGNSLRIHTAYSDYYTPDTYTF